MPNKKPTATAKVRVLEVLEDLDAEVNFAFAESLNDLISNLPIEVSADELYSLLTRTNNPKFLNMTSVSDLTTKITEAVKNNN